MQQRDNDLQHVEEKRRILSKNRTPLYWILRGLMVISFCFFLVFLAQIVVPMVQARSVSGRIPAPGTSTVEKEAEKPSADGQAAEEEASFNREDTAEISVDFLKLKSMNPDIMGWLTAGEKIDYPVVRGEDDEFYLSHNFFKENDRNGSIFLTQYNVLLPRDTILLIYGHNLATGDMFGRLPKYMDEAYMRQNALIQFRTVFTEKTGSDWYVPVAMFSASMDDDEPQFFNIRPVNFDSKDEYQTYLEKALSRSAWKAPTDVNTDDEILMLVTCSFNFINSRYVMMCRRLRTDETPEQMRELYLNETQSFNSEMYSAVQQTLIKF